MLWERWGGEGEMSSCGGWMDMRWDGLGEVWFSMSSLVGCVHSLCGC